MTAQQDQQAAALCPGCDAPAVRGYEFCAVCGTFLGWEQERAAERQVVRLPGADALPVGGDLARAASRARTAAQRAQAAAARAQVELERAERRAASAQERADRLAAEAPLVQARAQRTARALGRAEQAAGRARRAATQQPQPGGLDRLVATSRWVAEAQDAVTEARNRAAQAEDAQREAAVAAELEAITELRRARAAARRARRSGGDQVLPLARAARQADAARRQAAQAAEEADQAAAALGAVLVGVRAEVDAAPDAVARAHAQRDDARLLAERALAHAERAEAELALQRRLEALRATPRSVVPLEEATREASEAAARADAEVRRSGTKAERAERRRAAEEDRLRAEAEVRADDEELQGLARAEGTATRAAGLAEQAAQTAASTAAAAATAAPAGGPAPHALAPTDEQRAVRAPRAPTAPELDGPLACPLCAAGNPTVRTLCRRCGALLVPAPPPVATTQPGWWRRLLARLRRLLRLDPVPPVVLPAGARPVAGGNPDTAVALRRARVGDERVLRAGALRAAAPVVALVSVVAVALAAYLTPLGSAVANRFRDHARAVSDAVLPPQLLVPRAVKAPSSAKGTRPFCAIDGRPGTAWRPARGSGVGAVLGLGYRESWDLVAVTVTPQRLPRGARVRTLSLRYGTQVRFVQLRDAPGPQTVAVSGPVGVTDLVLRIDAVYPGAPGGPAAGIAEVSLTGKASPAQRLQRLRASATPGR